jgi:hypothetical protein
MADRILHFGDDECNRIIVLRSAGYSVEACPSLPNLDAALRNGGEPDAFVFAEERTPARYNGLTLVRSSSSAPVILFEHTLYCPDEPEYDLVISNLTPVQQWLDRIAALIEQSRAIFTSSPLTREQSARLRQESSDLREKSHQERERSLCARARAEMILDNYPLQKPSSDRTPD